MINTILFDLDGTLLSIDTERFTHNYFKSISSKLSSLFTAEEVTKYFWKSTGAMVKNRDCNKTNEEVFFEDFLKSTGVNKEKLMGLLEDFYKNDFKDVEKNIQPNEHILESINILKDKGYELVLATNPLFPRSAILDRIGWAGLNKEDFSFITSFEQMHYCKPQIEYYQETLDIIDKDPSECLMVGNHIREDMIAKEIDVNTYLITNNLIGDLDDGKNIDKKGTYKDFLEFVEDLSKID